MNNQELESMRNSFKTVKTKLEKVLKDPEVIKLKDNVQNIRKEAISNNSKLLEIAKQSFLRNDIDFFYAKTSTEAIAIIDEIIDIEKPEIITKAKSNTLREIGFNEHMKKRNIEVVETDLGDRILQLKETDNQPSHPTGPACHLNRYDIAGIVNKSMNKNISEEPQEIMDCVKEDVLNRIAKSDFGISGANSIAAVDGSIVLIHNEGNISLVSMKKTHLVIVGIDKLLNTVEDAVSVAKLETIYATGSLITSYLNVISGPSKTADIEKKLLKNMYGPKRVILIVLDNGREKVINKIPNTLECIGCGSCIVNCPVYSIIGNEFGYSSYLGGRGVAMANYIEDSKTSADSGLFKCSLCGQCSVNCPVLIPTYDLIEKTRKKAVKNGISPKEHKKIKENIKKTGSPY